MGEAFLSFLIITQNTCAAHKINELKTTIKTASPTCWQSMTGPAVKSPKAVGVL